MKLVYLTAVLACCGFVASNPFYLSRCLPAPGKYPFDIEKFSGDWYSVAKVLRPKNEEWIVTCHKNHYATEMVGNVTRIKINFNLKMADGSDKVVEGKGQGLKPGLSSVATMTFKHASDEKWNSVLKYSILATDYETYALIHGCKEYYDENSDTFSKFVVAHIWSRSRTLDEGTLKILKSVMSGFDIAEDQWEIYDNSAC